MAFVNLNFLVQDGSGRGIPNATVSIGTDFGNGTVRSTDGSGFANFGVEQGSTVSYGASAAGFLSTGGTVTSDADPTTVYATLGAIAAPPPPPPPPPPAPAPPPPVVTVPPAPAPQPLFVNFNVDVGDLAGHPLAGAVVTIDHDFGNGTTRTTDAAGAANFGVFAGASIGWHVSAPGHLSASGTQLMGQVASVIHIRLDVTAPAPPPPTPTPTPTPSPTPSPIVPPVLHDPGTAPGAPIAEDITTAPLVPPPLVVHDAVTHDASGAPHIRPEFVGDIPAPFLGNPYVAGVLLVVGVLSTLFSGGGGSDLAGLRTQVASIWRTLLDLGAAVTSALFAGEQRDGAGANIWSKVLGGILGPLINTIAQIFTKLHDTLAKWFDPLLKLLKRVQDVVRRIYNVWLRPILRVIDTVRQFLRILELFHVKWAAAADTALARLEAKITKPYLWALLELNKITNWIDYIVTAGGLFQRAVLLSSMLKHIDGVTNLWWNSQNRNTELYNGGKVVPLDDPPTIDQMREEYRQFFEDDSGPLQDEWNRWINGLNEEVM
jgi:hypothetical protein